MAGVPAESTAGLPFGEQSQALSRYGLGSWEFATVVGLTGGTGSANGPGSGLYRSRAAGGAFGWTGPLAYLLLTEVVLTGTSATPWIWVARPPHDLGGALCAYGVFAAGLLAATVLGARDSGRRGAPD